MTLQDMMVMYRAKHDISQSELAKLCKVTPQTIHMIENGLQQPSKLTRAKIMMVIKEVAE